MYICNQLMSDWSIYLSGSKIKNSFINNYCIV